MRFVILFFQCLANHRHLHSFPTRRSSDLDADGHCELQDMAFQHGVTNLVNAKPKDLPEDRRSLVLDFNMNRCILYRECVNICKDEQIEDALRDLKKEGTTQVVAQEHEQHVDRL